MKINNNLNVYSDYDNVEAKKIYKISIIVFAVFAVICTVLTILFNHIYSIIIGYVVGSLESVILFKLTDKWIFDAYYQNLKKVTERIHRLYQVVYLLTFFLMGFIFQSMWGVYGLVAGLLLIKISIFLSGLNKKYK